MKKFYAFAAAAMMAVSANAADVLYMVGSGSGLGWTPETPLEIELKDGNFTAEIKNLSEFKISTEKGDWDTFNTAALTCDYGKEVGATVALTEGDGNIAVPYEGDYTVVVAGDLSTITLTTETEAPTGPKALYLRGDMNGWLNAYIVENVIVDEEGVAAWQLEALSETVYKFVCKDDQKIGAGESFKIAPYNWSSPNIGAGEDAVTMLDTDTAVFDGSNTNLQVEEEWDGVLYLNTDLDGEMYLWFSNDKEATPDWYSAVSTIAADSNVAVKYFNLQGVQVSNPENGLYIVVKGDKATKMLVK